MLIGFVSGYAWSFILTSIAHLNANYGAPTMMIMQNFYFCYGGSLIWVRKDYEH